MQPCNTSLNLVGNAGFESGLLAPWFKALGAAAYIQGINAFAGTL